MRGAKGEVTTDDSIIQKAYECTLKATYSTNLGNVRQMDKFLINTYQLSNKLKKLNNPIKAMKLTNNKMLTI